MASIAANRNIWQKKNMKTNKQTKISSLESIMKEQQNEKKNATNDMVTISKDLQDLVDQGILTQNEALAMMQQNDAGPKMVQDEKNMIPISKDLQNLVNEGIISINDARQMMDNNNDNTKTNDNNDVLISPNTEDDEALAKAMQVEEELKAREIHEEAARKSNQKYGSIKIQFSTSLNNNNGNSSNINHNYIDDDKYLETEYYSYDNYEDETSFDAGDINKHSAEVSGRRNMKRLEKNTMSNSLGQMSDDTILNNHVYNSINEYFKKQGKADGRGISGRNPIENRKTKQGAFDARTKRGILKLINRGVIDNVNHVIRVGKEGVVCAAFGYGMTDNNDIIANGINGNERQKQHLAVKLFFTTLSDFKNRAEYVDGDPRYRNSHFSDQKYSASLKIWAEKEFRNYKRIENVGINCPKVYCVIDSTLIMSLIHTKGRPAKQLREIIDWTPKKLRRYYIKAVIIMKEMYKLCNLVHADLSEYNLMVNKQELYVIDVGQAVDTKHPKSLEYLKRDIKVITKFFYKLCKKINVNIGILKEAMLYDYILYEDDVNYDNDVNKFDSEKKDKAGYIHDNNRKDFLKLLKSIMENNLS